MFLSINSKHPNLLAMLGIAAGCSNLTIPGGQ